MVEGKKLENLSCKKEEGVGDTLPGFMVAQKGKTGNKIIPERILKLKGNMEFEGYIKKKYGEFDITSIEFCYRAVAPLQLNKFLKGPMSEKERDSLFLPTKNSERQGYYFSLDPKWETGYCSKKGAKLVVKVIIYFKEENHFLDNSELCLQSNVDCYPTHIIYLRQTSRMNRWKNIGYNVLGMVSNRWKSNVPDERIEREPESELEPDKIKVVEPKKHEAEEGKVVRAPKRNYVSQDIVSNGELPVWHWNVGEKEIKMKEYKKWKSKEMETIYQRWQQSTNTQKWENNKGKLSKEGKWTYEISFNEYNPNSWMQENTKTKKRRIIWRSIKCSVVDAEKVPTLPYSWSFKEQEGVYIKYYHIHQVEIEDIFQRWRAGGCGKGNLSRDLGGNIKQDYLVEFASSDWKQWNLYTKYARSLRREPAIDVSERIDTEPNIELLRASSPEFKEFRDEFMSAQTHGDLMEVRKIWKIKKVTGDIAFMEMLKRGKAKANIKTLYHGTTKENINSIIYDTDKTGFLMSTGERLRLGSGVYFAPDPGKSKLYSTDNQDFLLRARVDLEDSKYTQNKIYDEYCVTNESLAMPTHIIRYNIKCRLCGRFINNGDTERIRIKRAHIVHIVHTSCWQKRDNFIRCAPISTSG